ncbi:MAG TPA: hypothetical protein VFM57_03395 [Thermoleophilaceae bacterium]|nr:hypothetical protein [Thermoleophilaceae bacterium]
MTSGGRRPWWRSRWWMPGISLALGVAVFAAFAIGGNTADGLRGFALMAVLALVFAVGGRSETLSGLGGPGRDERWALIDTRASAFAGLVVLTAIIVSWLVEVANDRDGSTYVKLGALGGVAYIAAVAWQRLRS